MAAFVFIHGSFHAAWNWHKVIPILHQAGHTGIALDLPAHGLDRTPARRASLGRCVDKVSRCIDTLDESVVLVAHSRNAEERPGRILGSIYLAAYLVPDGSSMMEYAAMDPESLVAKNIAAGTDAKTMIALIPLLKNRWVRSLCAWLLPKALQCHALSPCAFKEALYHDCPDEITELASVVLQPEPNWAGFEPLRLTPGRYGRVPRVYIECLQDRAVTLPLQKRMVADSTCERVFSMDTSHSPFFSRPGDLVQVLIESLKLFEGERATAQGA